MIFCVNEISWFKILKTIYLNKMYIKIREGENIGLRINSVFTDPDVHPQLPLFVHLLMRHSPFPSDTIRTTLGRMGKSHSH